MTYNEKDAIVQLANATLSLANVIAASRTASPDEYSPDFGWIQADLSNAINAIAAQPTTMPETALLNAVEDKISQAVAYLSSNNRFRLSTIAEKLSELALLATTLSDNRILDEKFNAISSIALQIKNEL